MLVKNLQINVFSYPKREFLGTRFAPYRIFELGEKIISNAKEINSQVEEVATLHKKKEGEYFFQTQVID
jgi:hypothetical protein